MATQSRLEARSKGEKLPKTGWPRRRKRAALKTLVRSLPVAQACGMGIIANGELILGHARRVQRFGARR